MKPLIVVASAVALMNPGCKSNQEAKYAGPPTSDTGRRVQPSSNEEAGAWTNIAFANDASDAARGVVRRADDVAPTGDTVGSGGARGSGGGPGSGGSIETGDPTGAGGDITGSGGSGGDVGSSGSIRTSDTKGAGGDIGSGGAKL